MHPIYQSLKQLTRDDTRREMTDDEMAYYQSVIHDIEVGAAHVQDIHKEVIFQTRKPGNKTWTTDKLMLVSPRTYQSTPGGLILQNNSVAVRALQWPVNQDAQTRERRRILISSVRIRRPDDSGGRWLVRRHLAGVLAYNPNFKFHFTRKGLNRASTQYPVAYYAFALTEQQAQVFHRLKARLVARRSPSLEPLYWQPEKLNRLTEIITSLSV